MFTKAKSAIKSGSTDTLIGHETIIEGKIKMETSIRVDGKIFGEVECDGDVIIGEKGYIESAVHAQNIIIAGSINGKITASGRLHILSTGQFRGEAEMGSIVIEEGGIFQGESTMKSKNQSFGEAKLPFSEEQAEALLMD